MSRITTRALLSLGMLLALLVAGCGDEGAGAGKATAANPAKAAPNDPAARFVAEADAICAEANREETAIGAVGVDFVSDPTFDDPEFLARFTPIGAAALARLEKLEVPAGDEGNMNAATGAIALMIDTLEQRTADLEAGKDSHRADQVNDYLTGYNDLAVAAGPLGWTECVGLVL